jgi:cellulose synthase/poly-beta-1,6-N-acetylglucosamine synthase-like glycosyltransferase
LALAFWLAAAVVVYTWVGYPALVALLARWRPAPPVRKAPITPAVSIVIAVHNEEDCIEAKLAGCLALDYPADRLEVVVASDGSDDRTDALVPGFAPGRVRLVRLPRSGKAAALNAGVAQARGEILVLTDAREELEPDALRALVENFGDPQVGAASGELHLRLRENPEGGEGLGLYWRYEKAIRRAESTFDSTVGVTGALWALRRELHVPLDPQTILDDVALPMEIVLAGFRVVFEPGARAYDMISDAPRREYQRKNRTLAGNYQLLALRPALLDPRRNRLFFQFVSHKLARLVVPWCLLALLATSASLARGGGWLYTSALLAQLGFYALAVCGWLRSRYGHGPRFLDPAYSLVLLHLAAIAGLFSFLGGGYRRGWKGAGS